MRKASLDRLVVDHLPAAMVFATRLAGSPERAEEIVQESLLRAARGWKTFRGDAAFRTWFFRIVINVFREGLARTDAREMPFDENCVDLSSGSAVDPAEAAIAAELGERIATEVSRLPPRQREVLVLTAYEGMSTRDVARVVGISEANVYSTLSAARARLKARLAVYLKSVED